MRSKDRMSYLRCFPMKFLILAVILDLIINKLKICTDRKEQINSHEQLNAIDKYGYWGVINHQNP